MYPGKIVTFEGPDLSGKSTHAKFTYERLHMEYGGALEILFQKFPDYSTTTGELILNVLQGKRRVPSPMALANLFAENKLEQKDKIEGVLRRGGLVICDRYVESNLVYMVAAARQDPNLQEVMFHHVIYCEYDRNQMPSPDVTVLLEVEVDELQRRATRAHRDNNDRDLELQKEVADQYRYLYSQPYVINGKEVTWIVPPTKNFMTGQQLGIDPIQASIMNALVSNSALGPFFAEKRLPQLPFNPTALAALVK